MKLREVNWGEGKKSHGWWGKTALRTPKLHLHLSLLKLTAWLTLSAHVNRTVRLKGNTGTNAGGESVTVEGHADGFDPREFFFFFALLQCSTGVATTWCTHFINAAPVKLSRNLSSITLLEQTTGVPQWISQQSVCPCVATVRLPLAQNAP
jgi:hypothetical protein